MQKIAIVVIGILGLMGTQARAADMAVKAPLPAPPPVSDWSGVYFGLEGGYGWGKQNTNAISSGDPFTAALTQQFAGTLVFTPPLFFPDVALPSIKQRGWLLGGFLGAQKQWGNWVLGIEGDIDGADIKGSGTSIASFSSSNQALFTNDHAGLGFPCAGPCFTLNQNLSISSKIDALASLRGKVGWSFSPNWLIYGTGGAGFAHVENAVVSTGTATISPSILGQCVVGACTFSPNSLSNTLHCTAGRREAASIGNSRSMRARPWYSASNICTMDFPSSGSRSAIMPEQSARSEPPRTSTPSKVA
jgi:outer membrane immunogenic protein